MNKILSALVGFALCSSAHAQTSRQINQGDVSAFTVTSVGAGCGTSTGGSAITTTGNVTAAMPIRSVTGTTDTILSTDCGGRIVYNSASAVFVTLPVATTSGFGSGMFFDVVNEGAGTVTITPTTSTINLGSTLVLTTGQGAGVGSDGTNYSANLGKAASGTAANANTGTSGHTLPFLDGNNTHSGTETFGTVIGSGRTVSGTTDTLAQTDCGTTINYSNAGAQTVTIPATLTATCVIAIIQIGVGKVSVNGSAVTPASLHTAVASGAAVGTRAQFSIIDLTVYTTGVAILTGDGA